MMKKIQIAIILSLMMLIQGCGSHKRYSIEEIKEQAMLNDKEAQYRLGVYHEHKENHEEALKWYESSASLGCLVAQNELGNIYKEARLGLEQDYHKAVEYYQQASDGEYFDAINNLAYMNGQGLGVKKSRPKAMELYELAASKGSIRAMYNLGISYMYGDDELEKDYIKAYMWLDLGRYYTLTSKDMTLKWTIRARFDELDKELTYLEKKEAKKLGSQWIKELKEDIKFKISLQSNYCSHTYT